MSNDKNKTDEAIAQSGRTVGYNAKLQDMFGFDDGATKCSDCGELLSREDAFWALGQWWHKMVEDCQNNKAL